MDYSFTNYIKQTTKEYAKDTDDLYEAVDFFKRSDSFRKFSDGLTELFKRINYDGDLNNKLVMSDYLFEKLQEIGSSVSHETVYGWVSGKHSPKIEAGSRKKIYEICFALDLSYDETLWFFNHVYLDRAFNCHNITEAVYYYAFQNNISYQQAQEIINEIDSSCTDNNISKENEIYTQYIKSRITAFSDINTLKEFLIQNKHEFNQWNKSALKQLKILIEKLTGNESFKPEIEKLKRRLKYNLESTSNSSEKLSNQKTFIDEIKNNNNCGLIIKEILYDADYQQNFEHDEKGRYILEKINNKNIFKNSFILDYFLLTSSGIKKSIEIPVAAKLNFPSKKTMSDVLDESKVSTSQSYDAIRKIIILLDFYVFWVEYKLGISDTDDIDPSLIPEIYSDQINETLAVCGYDPLFEGNPYDWLFLCSANSPDPLKFFFECIQELISEDED